MVYLFLWRGFVDVILHTDLVSGCFRTFVVLVVCMFYEMKSVTFIKKIKNKKKITFLRSLRFSHVVYVGRKAKINLI